MELVRISSDQKILVIAPHPDDESIGCGAVLKQYGRQCDVIFLTDGCKGNPEWSKNHTKKIREEEARRALKLAKVQKKKFLGITDKELEKHKDCLFHFNLKIYDYIFVPGRWDEHPDHKMAYQCLKRALYHQRITKKVFSYEVWTPLREWTHYLPYRAENKKDLINCYQCQLKHVDYIEMSIGLGMYRAAKIKMPENLLAEVFLAEEIGYGKISFISEIKHIWKKCIHYVI